MRMLKIVRLILLIFFVASTGLHAIALAGGIPPEMLWGGRMQTHQELIVAEILSLLLNAFFVFIMICDLRFGRFMLSRRFIRVVLWFMFALFVLNTLGNLAAADDRERMIFTPITGLIASMILWRLLSREGRAADY